MIRDLIEAWCNYRGCEDWFLDFMIFIVVVIGLILTIFKLIKNLIQKIILWEKQRTLNKELRYYTPEDVDRATKYFVPIHYQNVDPASDDEPGGNYIASARGKLIPLFKKNVLKRGEDSNKYYLILADAGMGKTTFLINLYVEYLNEIRKPRDLHKLNIELIPLGLPDSLEIIKEIPAKDKTILLLDAFDEDIKAVRNYEKRLQELLIEVRRFRTIVLTCRTQFFPSEKEEPKRAGYWSGGEHGEYEFQKLYLSVFDDNQVRKYLRKRFSRIFEFSKYQKALNIAHKSPNLIVRPLLLSYIEELIDSNRSFDFSFEVYEQLISKWLDRESHKPELWKEFGSQERLKGALVEFSMNLALELYRNRESRGGYRLERGELTSILKEVKFSDDSSHLISEEIARSKSLLNRDGTGKYKFSHKSILEYFLALRCFQDEDFFTLFDFNGMEATKRFLMEMTSKRFGEKVEIMRNTWDPMIKETNWSIPKHFDSPINGLFITDLTDEPLWPLILIQHVAELHIDVREISQILQPLIDLKYSIGIDESGTSKMKSLCSQDVGLQNINQLWSSDLYPYTPRAIYEQHRILEKVEPGYTEDLARIVWTYRNRIDELIIHTHNMGYQEPGAGKIKRQIRDLLNLGSDRFKSIRSIRYQIFSRLADLALSGMKPIWGNCIKLISWLVI